MRIERDRAKTTLKTRYEIEKIRQSGKVLVELFQFVRPLMQEGERLLNISRAVGEFIEKAGVKPAMRGFGDYPEVCSLSVGPVAVHGLAGNTVLKEGDLVTLDVVVEHEGWHADAAWTYGVGALDPDLRRLLRAAWAASVAGIEATRAAGRIGDIGAAVQSAADRYGCSVLEPFVGHGIGREIHEGPTVFHTGEAGVGEPIVPGMVLTVEPVITLEPTEVAPGKDGFSLVTETGKPAAQFEQTLAVTAQETMILTSQRWKEFRNLDFPPEL
ncbi:MAG: type I methionyl aminopeptidase [Spirochaetales bacterium]|nr:type I methionyl aminopeptidase [Spirochaetales bacterium]